MQKTEIFNKKTHFVRRRYNSKRLGIRIFFDALSFLTFLV